MSSQKTEDHWQARASEAGSRERLKQANRRMDATEARADLAGRCLVRCPWRETTSSSVADLGQVKWQMA